MYVINMAYTVKAKSFKSHINTEVLDLYSIKMREFRFLPEFT